MLKAGILVLLTHVEVEEYHRTVCIHKTIGIRKSRNEHSIFVFFLYYTHAPEWVNFYLTFY